MSPRQYVSIIPAIVEVDSPFEKEIQKLSERSELRQDQVFVQSIRLWRRSSIFEEIIVPDPSVCRWLFDIISEDEHMTKDSADFILSEHQLIRVIAYTVDVVENKVVLSSKDKRCYGKFVHDGTRILRDISIKSQQIPQKYTLKSTSRSKKKSPVYTK
ncbi:MAG: hypothetical protein EZS28_008675 [Streblomastix strix]|uniref:Uncharacterized protein n=1 Tax=Streblomastix strix TaxID=222440 RepID=A0A5J4WLY4_9EUKA|nr:MAG: hypothetical protein EZS28_008675 [Streblomastix strix]